MAALSPQFTEMYDFGGLVIGDEGGNVGMWLPRVGAPGAPGTRWQGLESQEEAIAAAEEMLEDALAFFEFGIENDRDHFLHAFNATHTCLHGLLDPPRGIPYAEIATTRPDCPGWVEGTLTEDTWDINPKGGEPYESPKLESRQEILDLFDANVATARQRLATTPDDEFVKSWSLLSGGEALITMPKLGVIRTWVLNHIIHHRAHLCVYLRLNDIPVPALYGPSGDEEQ